MSALAKILTSLGKSVCGYDRSDGEYIRSLKSRGIAVSFDGADNRIYECDAVVCTDAVKSDDPLVRRAVALGKPVIPRGQLLAWLCTFYGKTIAVAGCHGKTTCVSMLAHIFACADRQFTAHIGGNDLAYGNSRCAGGDYFITEACEYNKNFLLLKPDISVILNTDADHLECYASEDELVSCYRQFADSSKKCVCLSTDRCMRGDVSFGFDERAYFRAVNIRSSCGKYTFDITEGGRYMCSIALNVYGRHNILNALAAAAAARQADICPEQISGGLRRFSGVSRRFENIGRYNGAEVIIDYAHHPREIAAALRTAAEVTDGEIYVIFQPHTYSRTKNLFGTFVSVLSGIKNLLIYKTFAAREYFDAEGSALTLSNAIRGSVYADSPEDIKQFLRGAGEGDKIFVLGAGDISFIVRQLII